MPVDINSIVATELHRKLSNLPPSIQGEDGRGALWHAAKILSESGVGIEKAHALLQECFNPRCEPPWPGQDLRYTLGRAFGLAGAGGANPRWPKLDRELRLRVVKDTNVRMAEFETWKPSRYQQPSPDHLLNDLFPDEDPLLCLGRTVKHYETKTKREWLGNLAGQQHLVPNPMTARTGNPDGFHRDIARCSENTGPRRYLVVEFDLVDPDLGVETPDAGFVREMKGQGRSVRDINASLIAHLASRGPLVMAVDSGGKSLHGWFWACGVGEESLREFFSYACRLGADRSFWTKCQAARLPDGIRDNGRIQAVKYFNEEAMR